jgi:hypothetical protein
MHMRRTSSRTLVVLAAVGLLVGLGQISGVSSAHAQSLTQAQGLTHAQARTTARPQGLGGEVVLPSPLCDESGWCMNDWYGGGSGTAVRYFEPLASSNEDLEVVETNRCGGLVTSNCPFTSILNNEEFNLDPVVEIYDTANGLCVSASGNATAVLGTCPNSSGTGGSPGNIFVYDSYNINAPDLLISNKYTNASGTAECVASRGGEDDGATIYLNVDSGSSSCSAWNS